jgi:hypothetical protein
MSAKLSPAQERVLYWLWAHPTVMIQVFPDDTKVTRSNWTHYWRDAAAFANMRRCANILNGGVIEAPRRAPAEGGTPKLTTATYHILKDSGLIDVVKYRPRAGGWSECWWLSITVKGREAIGVAG